MNKVTHTCLAALSVATVALCANTSLAQDHLPPPDGSDGVPLHEERESESESESSSEEYVGGCASDDQCKAGRICFEGVCTVTESSLPTKHPSDSGGREPTRAPSHYDRANYHAVGWQPGSDRPQRRFDFQQGDKVPEGFHLEDRPRFGLIATGVSVFAGLWITSASAAVAMDREPAQDDDPNFDDMYWPMFIPAVGPFVAIHTSDASGTGAAILAMDGVLQLAGLGMVIGGFAAPTIEIVEDRDLSIMPMASNDGGGLSLSAEF